MVRWVAQVEPMASSVHSFKNVRGVNEELGKMAAAGKPVTLLNIATAMDQQLSPKYPYPHQPVYHVQHSPKHGDHLPWGDAQRLSRLLLWPLDYMTGLVRC